MAGEDKATADLAAAIAGRLQAALAPATQVSAAGPVVQTTTPATSWQTQGGGFGAAPMVPAAQFAQQFAAAPQGAMPAPTGVMLRMTIPCPDGSEIPAYLCFGPEAVASPQVLLAVCQAAAAVYPIKVYPPRNNGWGGGQNGGGGWRGNGGGFRGGYGGGGGGGYGGGFGRRY